MATNKNQKESFESAVKIGQETFESAVKASTQVVQKNLEQTFETVKKRVEEATKGYGDIGAFGKETMEAVVTSGTVAAKGFEALNAEFVNLSKKAYEANVEALKALTAAKTPKEFFDIQNNLFKAGFQDMIAEQSRLGEISKTIATEAFEPINSRFTTAVESVSKQFAI
jgi:phasin family protein